MLLFSTFMPKTTKQTLLAQLRVRDNQIKANRVIGTPGCGKFANRIEFGFSGNQIYSRDARALTPQVRGSLHGSHSDAPLRDLSALSGVRPDDHAAPDRVR